MQVYCATLFILQEGIMTVEGNISRFYELCRKKGIALSLFFFLFTIFSFWLLTGDAAGVGKLEEITGGIGILDREFGFTAAEAQAHFSALGEEGRKFNLYSIIPLDMLFLISYTGLLVIILGKIILLRRPYGVYASRTRFVLSVPVAAGLADIIENISQAIILAQYPDHPESILALLSFINPAKFLLVAAALALLLAELILAGLRSPSSDDG